MKGVVGIMCAGCSTVLHVCAVFVASAKKGEKRNERGLPGGFVRQRWRMEQRKEKRSKLSQAEEESIGGRAVGEGIG